MTNKLIKCESCSKEISTLAETCPSCGSPNSWVHPKIIEFKEADIQTPKEFTYHYNKVQIWGETEPTLPWWIWLVVIFTSVPGLAFGIIPGLIIAPIAYWLLSTMYGKKYEFSADLLKGAWKSNDEKFWKSVREKLEL